MGTGRMEAFSDGVIAIIITIMVLGSPQLADLIYALVAVIWIVPDPRIAGRVRS